MSSDELGKVTRQMAPCAKGPTAINGPYAAREVFEEEGDE